MPDFRHRLTRAQQRHYDRSNAVSAIPLKASPGLLSAVAALEAALADGERERVNRVARTLCDEVCRLLGVPAVRVSVGGTRPANRRGELHGLYTPGRPGQRDTVEVWMTTVKRRQTVAFKTFLRTLVHELCHHLDYHLLRLGESFHTDGFFKRESSLVKQLLRPSPARTRAPTVALRGHTVGRS